MKRQVVSLMVVFSVALLFGLSRAWTEAPTLEEKIRQATALLLDSSLSEEKTKGFLLLVESIELAAAGTELPAEFNNKVSSAQKILASRSILDEKAGQGLRDAYALINSGEKFQFPAQVRNMPQAVQYCRDKIGTALDELKSGNKEGTVKSLLEVVLVVITPMQATS